MADNDLQVRKVDWIPVSCLKDQWVAQKPLLPFKSLPSSSLKISLVLCFPLQRELGIMCLLLIVYGYLALASVLLLAPQEDFISWHFKNQSIYFSGKYSNSFPNNDKKLQYILHEKSRKNIKICVQW